jgi:hypothetical protein
MRSGNFQFGIILPGNNRDHTADFFNQTGEHEQCVSTRERFRSQMMNAPIRDFGTLNP